MGTGPVQAVSSSPPTSGVERANGAQPASEPPPGFAATWDSAVPPGGPRTPVPRGIFAAGEQFGVYRIGPCIGEGGMARVYEAEHSGLRRKVALKVLLDASTRAPEGRERFVREARMAAAIKHPNVVNIFDVGVQDDTPYLVMELLTGTDLEQLLQSRGALDESTIVDIMVPVIAGLTAVHDAGVVHRDLKPGNIFLAQGRFDEVDPKLLDFGICAAPGVEQLRLTANGMLIGTPFYMSPEGLRGDVMTPSSDQYSLGVVMYECVTGVNPFGASTFAEIFKLIGAGESPPPSAARPQLSKRLERIIMRAMSVEPAHRFKDLREMGRELLLLAGQRTRITWALSFGELERGSKPAAGSSPFDSRPSSASSTPPHGRRRWLLAAPLLLVVLALALGRWAVTPQPSPGAPALGSGSTGPLAPAARDAERQQPATAEAAPSDAPAGAPSAGVMPGPTSRAAQGPQGPQHRLAHQHPAAPTIAGPLPQKPEDSGPDWAVPINAASAPRPEPARPQTGVGANGAPIFD